MSLAKLREKLNQLSTQNVSEDNFSFDADHNTYLQKISNRGNRPDDWLDYIEMVNKEVPFPTKLSRHNSICDLYEKAFRDINSDANKTNEAYARLFVSYARLKSEYVSVDARLIFNNARAIVRRFAFVHIAAAQFEIDAGDKVKGRKILEKAFMFEAKPTEDIEEALKKLKEGNTHLYTSPVAVKPSQEKSERVRVLSGERVRVPSGETPMDCRPSNSEQPLATDSVPTRELKMEIEHFRIPSLLSEPPSVSRHGMRSYHSTPLLNSEKRRVRANVGLPARVKKVNLPFNHEVNEEEEFEEQDTMDSFKPLDRMANSTFGSTHAHTSGYLSMTQTTENTSPLTNKPTPVQLEKPDIPHKENNLPKPKMDLSMSEKPAPFPQPLAPICSDNKEPLLASNISQPAVMSTPCMKQSVPPMPASTPMNNFKVLTVNGQQYVVMDVIGKGGSSKVYQVFHSEYRSLAIKCVNLNNTNDLIIQGYKNEIKLLERLQYCDKVIKMYDSEFVPDENKLYVVMEQGSEDLATFFRRQTKDGKGLSSHVVRCYWEMMLQAVQALHKEGIIHSDLKPANFLLVGGNLKLIDFGIAKTIQQDKTSVILETQVGTLNFMSPETIMDSSSEPEGNQGKPRFKVGVKSDVWSLGCILYNMVYGRTPFQHIRKDFMKLQAIINPDYPINFPEIPNKHLIDVMQKCLCRDPKMRPSIDELLAHPYLTVEGGKEEKAPTSIIMDKRMETVVSSIADQYALSPNGLRNFLMKINADQETNPGSDCSAAYPAGCKKQGPVNVKHVRAPLQSLNVEGLQASCKGKNGSCFDAT